MVSLLYECSRMRKYEVESCSYTRSKQTSKDDEMATAGAARRHWSLAGRRSRSEAPQCGFRPVSETLETSPIRVVVMKLQSSLSS
jgi:hypothetical protein